MVISVINKDLKITRASAFQGFKDQLWLKVIQGMLVIRLMERQEAKNSFGASPML